MKTRRAQERTQHRPVAVPSSHSPLWSDTASKIEWGRTGRDVVLEVRDVRYQVVDLDCDCVDLAARARCEERIGRASPIGEVTFATTGLTSFVRFPYGMM
jgi:hypothetical protein